MIVWIRFNRPLSRFHKFGIAEGTRLVADESGFAFLADNEQP